MLVVIHNKSKGKQFRKTKRIISEVLPFVDIRLNLGDIPLRVLIKLISNLKKSSGRGTCVQVFFKATEGFHGFKLVEIGKKTGWLNNFKYSKSAIDTDLKNIGINVDCCF